MKKFICLLTFLSLVPFSKAQAEIIQRTGLGAAVTRYGFIYDSNSNNEIVNRTSAREDALNRAIAAAAAPPLNTELCPSGTIDLGTASPIPPIAKESCVQVAATSSPDPVGVSKCTDSVPGSLSGYYCFKCTVTLGLTKECALPGN